MVIFGMLLILRVLMVVVNFGNGVDIRGDDVDVAVVVVLILVVMMMMVEFVR